MSAILLKATLAMTICVVTSIAHAKESSLKRGGHTYSIKTKLREMTSPYTYESVAIDYSVYRDGVFLHRTERSGGTLTGCRYGSRDMHEVEPVEKRGKGYGWLVKTLGVCGNTTSLRIHFVHVEGGESPRYGVLEFMSKTDPQWLSSGSSDQLWFIYQEWGLAGTAGSAFVPMAYDISLDGARVIVKPAALPKDFADWPTFKGLEYSAPSFVIAGINTFDSRPIHMVADKLTKDKIEHLEYIGLPASKTALKELAAAVEGQGLYIGRFLRRPGSL